MERRRDSVDGIQRAPIVQQRLVVGVLNGRVDVELSNPKQTLMQFNDNPVRGVVVRGMHAESGVAPLQFQTKRIPRKQRTILVEETEVRFDEKVHSLARRS